ncbi:pseudouridine-5'-phosphate glycosidase [Streptomyces collinus]|uniref:pseudouridine-5'-phosphate glycosidase n=1 Tax=Streptomyces collinus TaxID=42684 RepID=UPI0036813632
MKVPLQSQEVSDALAQGAPVVALESTIITHGLPRPWNLQLALELEEIIREEGAVPATIAVLAGVPTVGLDSHQIEFAATGTGLRKLGFRDLPVAMALQISGGTTISATAYLAASAGIRVFATGGLGGVHRGWVQAQDESADLDMLGRTCITVVCAGVKSILDVPATLERLETKSVTVTAYRSDTFPGFLLHSSGKAVDWRIDSPEQVAAIMRGQDALADRTGALIVGNPVPEDQQLDPELHNRVLANACEAAEAENVTGQAVTPYLLGHLIKETGDAAVETNLAAVRANARLAAQIAVAFAAGA